MQIAQDVAQIALYGLRDMLLKYTTNISQNSPDVVQTPIYGLYDFGAKFQGLGPQY